MNLPACTRGPDGTPCGNVPRAGEAFRKGTLSNGAHCYKCWRANVGYKRQPPKQAIVREVRCLHLAKRLEVRYGCGGMKCLHECTEGLPAVPGIYCQTCEKYEADAGPWV